MSTRKIYVIAGEASGDLHGANLILELRKKFSASLEVYGVGGDKIKAAGAKNFIDLAHFHVTGITQILFKLSKFLKAFDQILADIADAKPDLVVLIDNPGFNLRLAKKLHEQNIPLVYYITPQVWAWGQSRIELIKKYFLKVLVVFDFEETLFKKHGVPVSFVGHPLKDIINNIEPEFKASDEVRVMLLPGSRDEEVERLLPVYLQASKIVERKIPSSRFYILQSPALPKTFYDRILKKFDHLRHAARLVDANHYGWIKSADGACVCSGTATLETALLGTPQLITYQGSWITYQYAKRMIKIPNIGLPNIILGDKKIPEFLQNEVRPQKIADTLLLILENKEYADSIRKNLREVSEKLGGGGATQKAAAEISKILENR